MSASWWSDKVRSFACEARKSEFVGAVSVAAGDFPRWDRVGAGGAGDAVEVWGQVVRREVQNTLLCAEKIGGCGGGGIEAQHAAVGEPEDGGHGADVCGAIRVGGGDKDNGSAPVENCG